MNKSSCTTNIPMIAAALLVLTTNVATAEGGFATVRVPAHIEWVDSGVAVDAGDVVSIVAMGRALTGPLATFPEAISGPDGQATLCLVAEVPFTPCALEGAPYGALVGRVDGITFLVGAASGPLVMPASGTLELAVNDNTGFYDDNRAGYVVNIFSAP